MIVLKTIQIKLYCFQYKSVCIEKNTNQFVFEEIQKMFVLRTVQNNLYLNQYKKVFVLGKVQSLLLLYQMIKRELRVELSKNSSDQKDLFNFF